MQNAVATTRYEREFDDTAKRFRPRAVTEVPLPGKWEGTRKLVATTHWRYRFCAEAGGWYMPEGALVTQVSCFDAGNFAGTLLYHWWTRPERVTKKAVREQHEKVLAEEMDYLVRKAEKLPV